jgi:hypothetical protein
MLVPPFPKIPSYKGTADLLHTVRQVICLEKIDGTNTRIGLSYTCAVTSTDPTKAVIVGGRTLLEGEEGYSQPVLGQTIRKDPALCKALRELVLEFGSDVVLYGETCGGRIQRSGFIYGSKPHFLLFAATIGNIWCSWSHAIPIEGGFLPTLQQLTKRLQVSTPPLLYHDVPDTVAFEGLLERPSAHSLKQNFHREDIDRTQEGIVIWADPLLRIPQGLPLAAKLKHPRRREHSPATIDDGVEGFAHRAVPLERLYHGIEHLEVSGRWPSDLSERLDRLTRRVIQDVSREVPEYQEQMSKHSKATVRAALAEVVRQRAKLLDLE